MNCTSYEYDVKPVIELSKPEVEALITLAEMHYDFKCQSFAQPGGLLYGFRNLFTNDETGVISVTLKLRDIDTLCKILEGASFPGTPELGKDLWFPMRALFQKGAAEQSRLNEIGKTDG
jgi:hypothetical protein